MATSPPFPTYPPHPDPGVPGGVFRHRHWWQRASVRYGALITLLALSGLVILALVRRETGTEGFLVGLGLAVLPVPLLVAAFVWLDRVDPAPWRNLLFAFAWGACAAALIAIIANSFATRWIATSTADPVDANTIGATVVAPIVEESSKAAAVLLVFLFRRRHFTGIVDGVVTAGVTATGFAFTENILYLGNAFGSDQLSGGRGIPSVTAATFFVRVVMSPFAHPLFTVCTGIGFGIAALSAERQRLRRFLVPPCGLLLAMGMHAFWNGSATFGPLGFFAVYGGFMAPAFGLLTWLVIWIRQRELRAVREELPAYVAAGWLTPAEPFALGSMRARRTARDYARHHLGKPAAREVAGYEADATTLAFLRRRAHRGRAGADFAVREQELLQKLWRRREAARPALEYAARVTAPRRPAAAYPPLLPGYPHPAYPGYPYPGPPGHPTRPALPLQQVWRGSAAAPAGPAPGPAPVPAPGSAGATAARPPVPPPSGPAQAWGHGTAPSGQAHHPYRP
ncbi:PrsW family intramembrane metalloprotease [Streptomyces sp. MS06]|uniref:PrsW family intramembrane metalloprotease n=1 Tax=Streptomyces sp. MS06 TaxID=3385974 RepID=UPI0039A1BC19